MTWTLVEGVIDAVRDYMRLHFDDKLDQLNEEYDDSIHLVHVIDFGNGPVWHIAEQTLESLQQFPVGFILGGPSTVGYWNQTHTEGGHELTVAVMADDQEYEALRRRLYRYQRAIWECLVDAHFVSELSGFRLIGSPRMDISPILTRNSMGLGEARVVVNVTKQEVRS